MVTFKEISGKITRIGEQHGIPLDSSVEQGTVIELVLNKSNFHVQQGKRPGALELFWGKRVNHIDSTALLGTYDTANASDTAARILETSLGHAVAEAYAIKTKQPNTPSKIEGCEIKCEITRAGICTEVAGDKLSGRFTETGFPDVDKAASMAKKIQQGLPVTATGFPDSNMDRAAQGAAVMKSFAKLAGTEKEPVTDNVTDLLTNLMHYADKNGIDFAACMATAVNHHQEEKGASMPEISVARLSNRLEASVAPQSSHSISH